LARKKPVQRKTLVKKLDKIVGDYIKLRDSYRCVQCGSVDKPSWGHVFSRRSYSTRWDLENGFCQCWSCNFKHSHDNYEYYKWFQDRFGADKFEDLRKRYISSVKYTNLDLQDLYKEMVKKFKELEDSIY